MNTRIMRMVLGTLSGLMLGACALDPHATAPRTGLPERYTADSQPLVSATADGSAQRFALGARAVPAWWEAYGSNALDDLVREGLDRSPSLASARGTLKAAREGLRAQVGESLFPQVDVGFDPSRQRALAIPVLPQQTLLYDVFALEAQGSYTFDFFGAALHADRALAAQVDQQSFQVDAARRDLAANIVSTTIAIAALDEEIEATTQMVALAEQSAQQTRDRHGLGAVSRGDAHLADLDAAGQAAALPALRAQLATLRHGQAVLLGRNPQDAPPPLQLADLKLPQEVPVSVPSALLGQRPDILGAAAALRAAANEADAAAAAMLPSLTLSASYGRGGFDWGTFTSPQGAIWSVGASLTQPLFHGGALRARKRQYQATYEAAAAQYRQTVLSAFQQVADRLATLDEDADTLRQAERAAEAARLADADMTLRYKLGSVPFSATLAAGRQYQNARVTLLRARAARLSDTALLFQAMGDPPAT